MKKLLLIDATNRPDSRTIDLALAYIHKYEDDYQIERLMLNECDIKPLTNEEIMQRSVYNEAKDFDHPLYDLAKQFKNADVIVVAAPYYDLSYPSILKVYIEHIMCTNLTFRYEGSDAVGLCKARKLVYVTTAGGYIGDNDFGYEYIKAISEMLGIKTHEMISAEGLDIFGNDPAAIMKQAKKDLIS